jgi:hypothetical protein
MFIDKNLANALAKQNSKLLNSGTSDGVKKAWESRKAHLGTMSNDELAAHRKATNDHYDNIGHEEMDGQTHESSGSAGAGKRDRFQIKMDTGSVPGEISHAGISIYNPNRGNAHFRIRSPEDFDSIKEKFGEAMDKAKSAYAAHQTKKDGVWDELGSIYQEQKRRGLIGS